MTLPGATRSWRHWAGPSGSYGGLMKLLRLGEPGAERPGVRIGEDSYIDVSDVVHDFDEEFFGSDGIARLGELIASRADRAQPLDGVRIGAPIARPHQILCIGLNYRDHA